MKDKGFSLIEIIVVVLIMGIITVALAPQVMKWVTISRVNSDEYEAESIKSAVSISVGEYESAGNILKDSIYNVKKSGLIPVGTDRNEGFTVVVSAVMGGEYPRVHNEEGKIFQIRCWQDGKKIDVVIVSGEWEED